MKIMVWTPDVTFTTGQNIVTRCVIRMLNCRAVVFEYPMEGRSKVFVSFWRGLKLLRCAWSSSGPKIIYAAVSRSRLGFLRDLPVLLAARSGCRVFTHVHGSDLPNLLQRPFIGVVARFLYSRCDLIVPSSHVALEVSKYSFRSLSICENFFPGDIPEVVCDTSNLVLNEHGGQCLKLLWNSNIMAEKGVFELIEACKIVVSEGYSIELVLLGNVVGDAEYSRAEALARLQSSLDLSWITFIGSVPLEDVTHHLCNADVVALPSTYSSECQPLALIQAMVLGKIILVSPTRALMTTVGAYPAVFSDRKVDAIAGALRHIMIARDDLAVTSMKSAGQSRQRFSADAFQSRIFSILART